MFTRLGISAVFLACTLASSLVACVPAETTKPTTTTAADMTGTTPSEAAEGKTEGSQAPVAKTSEAPKADPALGQLVCRTTRPVEGTSELYLKWEGKEAKGIIRTTAPSGMEHEQKVRAERAEGVIVVDDPHESDLVMHAAMVREKNGKTYIRLGDGNKAWSVCE